MFVISPRASRLQDYTLIHKEAHMIKVANLYFTMERTYRENAIKDAVVVYLKQCFTRKLYVAVVGMCAIRTRSESSIC